MFTLITIGTKMPKWVTDGYEDYARRLPKELSPKLIELPLATRSKTYNRTKAKGDEAAKVMAAIKPQQYVIALDVLGKAQSTENFAIQLESWKNEAKQVAMLIGGPDGLSKECLDRADEKWSLSAMTLPHPIVRVVVIEQLYRAWTITQNHPYHK